ncbi:MAG: caspase family protein [Candidatus Binatus sp.]
MKATTFAYGRALVIAVANYDEITSLPEAVLNDARDISGALSSPNYCGYDPRQVTTLLDKAATIAAIRHGLATLASSSREEDTVFIYFSGHGARLKQGGEDTSFLLPVDCQRSNPSGTSLSEAEFSKALAAIPARRLLVVLDACHSGGAGSLKQDGFPAFDEGYAEKDLERLTQGAGRVIMASSRPSETSLVLPGARNSLFTERFLEALRGAAQTHGDGLIRVFEVFNYVAETVRGSVPGRQHPIFKASDLEDNFPVALYCGGTKSPAPLCLVSPPWRQLEEILADLYPAGPLDDEIWSRAGGDVSRLRLSGTGRAMWFAALRTLRQGGGGANITTKRLIATALGDFPHHPELQAVSVSV